MIFKRDLDNMMKEMDVLDDMISSCEIYNRENFEPKFVETSSEDEDSVDLENIRISEQNFQASPLYKKKFDKSNDIPN